MKRSRNNTRVVKSVENKLTSPSVGKEMEELLLIHYILRLLGENNVTLMLSEISDVSLVLWVALHDITIGLSIELFDSF